MSKKSEYIVREISWLSFNERVLQEAENPSVPLIERIRFLGIFSNNLDEFFRVRVASIRRMVTLGKKAKEIVGESPVKILEKIHKIVIRQQSRFEKVYQKIIKELRKENIYIINETKLDNEQGTFVRRFFTENIHAHLSPIMISRTGKVPYLKDRSIYFAVTFYLKKEAQTPHYSLIEIPTDICSRFIVLPAIKEKKYIILLDDAIRYCLSDIFSVFRFDVIGAYTIKLTRDTELDIDDDVSKSFLENISKSVKRRQKGELVRFVYDSSISDNLLSFILKKINLFKNDGLIPGGRYHNFKDFIHFPNIGSEKLIYPPIAPLTYPPLKTGESILDIMEKQDFLLHYPYHSFDHFVNMLREAAIDPDVTLIKITLYRLAKGKSKIINSLINAAQNGKSVTVVIELQARFDEEANVSWSNQLQEEGIKVLFGVPGLKVHSKICLIGKKKGGKLVHYANISTGNYNEDTAKTYSDTTFFTTDRRITLEVNKMFSFLENNYKTYKYKHLVLSPFRMREKFTMLINNEIKNASVGKQAYITLKINNLVDQEMIEKLYTASKANVKIKLIIRGICSLIPGIPGLSENIEAISIVDRYLEHSRIFVFCNNENPLYYISSADWMTRNLDYRVETACPIYDKKLQQELKDILEYQLRDNVKARIINNYLSNSYRKDDDEHKVQSQIAIYKYLQQKSIDEKIEA